MIWTVVTLCTAAVVGIVIWIALTFGIANSLYLWAIVVLTVLWIIDKYMKNQILNDIQLIIKNYQAELNRKTGKRLGKINRETNKSCLKET